MPHLNNKQNKNTNQIISRQDYHLTQHSPSEKKTNKNPKTQHKAHPIRSSNKPLNQLRKAETKRKKSAFFKERIQLSLKPGKRRLQKQ